MNSEIKTYYRTLHSFLKHQEKDKNLLVRTDFGWHLALACKSKTKAGRKYNRLAKLIRKIKKARNRYV